MSFPKVVRGPTADARREARAEYQQQLRRLRGEVEEPAPRPVPAVATCCGLARVDPSACTCGGKVVCPTHSPNGVCLMQFTHD